MADAESLRDRLTGVMADARVRHSASDLERLEEAYRLFTSDAEPPLRAPHQGAPFIYPGLTARPWHDAAAFEATSILEGAFETIRTEFLEASGSNVVRPWIEQPLLGEGAWNSMLLRRGDAKAPGQSLCPKTSAILSTLPGVGDMAMFSILDPGSHILPHCGEWNCRLTMHLGLVIPDGCTFRVADETRTWTEGRCLLFDDSFEHEVWNRSERRRVVLLVDLWHPELTAVEIEALSRFADIVYEGRSDYHDVISAEGRSEGDGGA